MITFYILATLLLAIALLILLPPLLRSGGSINRDAREIRQRLKQIETDLEAGLITRDSAEAMRHDLSQALMKKVSGDGNQEQSTKSTITAVVLLISVPLLSLWLYQSVGLPEAVDLKFDRAAGGQPQGAANQPPAEATDSNAPSLEQAMAGLEARLKQQPEDVEGWVLLGRSYIQLGRNQDAVAAFERARELAPEEPWVLVDLVEARFMASGAPQISDADVALLEQAVEMDPSHQKGIWMLGIAAYQRGNFNQAVSQFERLQGMLEPGSAVADTVAQQIADARARAGMPAVSAPPEVAESSIAGSADADGPRLTVAVSVDPALKSQISPGDILFVFAKAANGPPMPLAVQRLAAGALPTTVTLDKEMSMTPQFTLETFPEVVVGARISKSGNATAQPGDFEGVSDPVANTHSETIQLTINRVVGG